MGAAAAARRRVCARSRAVSDRGRLALGATPVYEILASGPLRAVRYPVKATLAASLCWSLLAGVGFDTWASGTAVARRAWLLLVIVPLGLATLGSSALAGALTLWPNRLGRMFLVPPEPVISFRPLLLGTVPSLAFAALAGAVASIAAILRLVEARRFTPLAMMVATAAIVPTAIWPRGYPGAARSLHAAASAGGGAQPARCACTSQLASPARVAVSRARLPLRSRGLPGCNPA